MPSHLECTAILLSLRRYGESDAIAHFFTQEGGRFAGFVRGGASRRQAARWQTGNVLYVRYANRLTSQLGRASAELVASIGGKIFERPYALAALTCAMALLDAALPEREPHPMLYIETLSLLNNLSLLPTAEMLACYVRWEGALLTALGYGLDLSCCALTGRRDGLCYVSPKTGRAVSREAAAPWQEKLLVLPSFLLNPNERGSLEDWKTGLRLTGHFLSTYAFEARSKKMPSDRARFVTMLERLQNEELG